MKKLNITKEQFEKFNESEDDAVKELCMEDGAAVINATATIEEFNNKIYELTGKHVIDPDEFFATSGDLSLSKRVFDKNIDIKLRGKNNEKTKHNKRVV